MHWRLHGELAPNLMVWVHFRAQDQSDNEGARFGDDFPLPGFLAGLGPAPQDVMVRRRIVVPADQAPGRYRLVAGVWNPRSGWRLHRWWRGLVPTLDRSLALGRVEVVRGAP